MPSGDTAITTVRCEGDLDIVTSEDVKRQLAALVETGSSTVTLDLRDVGFSDSKRLGAPRAGPPLRRGQGRPPRGARRAHARPRPVQPHPPRQPAHGRVIRLPLTG